MLSFPSKFEKYWFYACPAQAYIILVMILMTEVKQWQLG